MRKATKVAGEEFSPVLVRPLRKEKDWLGGILPELQSRFSQGIRLWRSGLFSIQRPDEVKDPKTVPFLDFVPDAGTYPAVGQNRVCFAGFAFAKHLPLWCNQPANRRRMVGR